MMGSECTEFSWEVLQCCGRTLETNRTNPKTNL